MLKVGSKNVTALKVGTKNVVKVYKGTTLVWPTTDLLSVTPSSLSFSAAGQTQNLTINVPTGQAWTLSVPSGSAYSVSKTSGTGKTTISVTIGNNTTTNSRSSTLTVSSTGLTATCNCSQSAGSKVYGNPIISTYSYPLVSAAGGTSTPSLSYSQVWTWNGVANSGGTITSGASLSYSGTNINATSGVATIASKGTTISNTTTATTGTVKVTLNGKSGSATATVYQAANYLTAVSVTPGSFSYSVAPAAAGNSTPTQTGSDSLTFAFSSGTTSSSGNLVPYYDATSSVSYSWGGAAGFFNSLNTSTGVVSTTTAGTTPINSQLAGPPVTKKLSMTYTPKSTLGAGSTINTSGTATAYPQKGTNTKSYSSNTRCSGTTLIRPYTWTSEVTGEDTSENSYTCGYRVNCSISLKVMQKGIMVSPVFKIVQAWSCRTNNISGQGSSTVVFSNPGFGDNIDTLTLNSSETGASSGFNPLKYVLIQCNITYTDSGGTGAIPAYSWNGAVTSSGSLAIYSVSSNIVQASVSVSAQARSAMTLQEDAAKMLEQIESGELKVSDDIKNQLTQLANK